MRPVFFHSRAFSQTRQAGREAERKDSLNAPLPVEKHLTLFPSFFTQENIYNGKRNSLHLSREGEMEGRAAKDKVAFCTTKHSVKINSVRLH